MQTTGSAFQNMIVWQKAMVVVEKTYLFTKELPKDEQFGIISQMRRCAVSIPSNIAEGSKRGTKKDFAQFLRIASGSAAELETQLLLAQRLFGKDIVAVRVVLIEVQKMLETLLRKL